MAGLIEASQWEAQVYQLETTDPVHGGPPDLAQGQGFANAPHAQLANRTAWLKDQIALLQTDLSNLVTLTSQDVQALIDAAIAGLIGGAPAALDTLNELAAALGDDANFASSVTAALADRIPQSSWDDETAGRLLRVGAFGLGGALPLVSDLDLVGFTGMFAFDLNSLNKPGPVNASGTVLAMNPGTANNRTQMAVLTHPAANEGEVYVRHNQAGWSAWVRLASTDDLDALDAVPLADFTGTNVFKGTNGYQVLPSGLIIQWGLLLVGSPGAGGEFVATLPMTFPVTTLSVQATLVTPDSNAAGRPVIYSVSNTTSTARFMFQEDFAANENVSIQYLAIGH